jgi:ATP-binding cassette, subfamily B, bacterial MsbA
MPDFSAVMSRADWRLIRGFERRYVRPLRAQLWIATVLMTFASLAQIGQILVIRPFVDDVLVRRNLDLALVLPLFSAAFTIVTSLALYGYSVLIAIVQARALGAMQSDIYRRLITADMAWLDRTNSGELSALCMSHVHDVVGTITGLISAVARDLFMVVVLLGVLIWLDLELALVSALVIPLMGLGLRRISRRVRRGSEDHVRITDRIARSLTEVFGGIRVVRLSNMTDVENRRFRGLLDERRRVALRVMRIGQASGPVNEFVFGVVMAAIVVVAAWRVGSGASTLGTLFTFPAALLIAYRPLKRISQMLATLQRALVAARSLQAVLDLRNAVADAPDARPLALRDGVVRFEDVSFAYDPDRPVLQHVTLEVPAGAFVALVGPSGGGKSTLLALISRLYDATSGRVTIDGQDVRSVTLDSLRGAIAAVTQETILFDGTVRENIAYGRPGAGEHEIVAAAKSAGAHEFIMALQGEYEAGVGERGGLLSGGQRQRIAIARAFLRNAPILLLDEPTSALDSETEKIVKAALAILAKGRTTIAIAHRLSTISDADMIHVVAEGRIVESGAHAQLLAKGGLYARLWSAQDGAAA